jgi:hypothetical protein
MAVCAFITIALVFYLGQIAYLLLHKSLPLRSSMIMALMPMGILILLRIARWQAVKNWIWETG